MKDVTEIPTCIQNFLQTISRKVIWDWCYREGISLVSTSLTEQIFLHPYSPREARLYWQVRDTALPLIMLLI